MAHSAHRVDASSAGGRRSSRVRPAVEEVERRALLSVAHPAAEVSAKAANVPPHFFRAQIARFAPEYRPIPLSIPKT
jgi:hypothetical protein